jgi:hypothetical protein
VPALQDDERGVKILHLHPGPDTGGQSMGGKPILEAAGHEVRVLARPHPFGYPRPEMWMPGTREIEEAFVWADLVIVHNMPRTYELVAMGRRKPLIIHHHGSKFRRDCNGPNPLQLYRRAADLGAVQVVSTVDLLCGVPGEIYWQPQNIDLAKMRAIRAKSYVGGGKIRVAHAPTNRAIKGTRMLQQSLRGLNVDFLLIEHRPWEKCLQIKALADIYADQFLLGYGNNAIEAWAMGMPVLAGADDRTLARMRAEYGGTLPFLTSDKDNLAANIDALARSPKLRAEWADRGMAHVERFHAPAAWLARFEMLAGLAFDRFAERAA